jgi:Thioredoxin
MAQRGTRTAVDRKRSQSEARTSKATQASRRAEDSSHKTPWTRLGIIALLAATAAITTLVLGDHSNSRAALDRRTDHEVSALLTGIPQNGNTLGRPTAPVTLQFFGDLECLTTKNWVTRLLPAIIQDFVRTGTIKIQYLSLKTDTIHPQVFVNQETAALAAGAQSKMWNFVETFYHEQGREYTPYVTESYLDGIARQTPGLNITQWHHDRETGRRSEQVVTDDQTARALGFHDTPAFRIGRTGQPFRNFSGRTVILEFAGFARMKYPVSLIDTQDLTTAIKELTASSP